MAFIKKLWKDRISQFPNRRTINDGSVTKQVTVGRDEGTVTEEGDTFDASNMNDLEQRIEDAYGDVVSLVASEVAVQYHGDVIFDNVPTTSHGVGYAVTSDGLKTALDSKADTSAIPDELNDLSDVDISGQALGEALVWGGTKWVNGTVSTVGNLDDLSDVDTTGKQEGDSLRYIGNEWKAKPTTVEMTQAEYDAIVDFTEYANTHIVITDAPNLNPTASDIEYSSGVSVADKLDEMPTKTSDLTNDSWFVGLWKGVGEFTLTNGQTGNLTLNEDISDAREVLIGFFIDIGTIGRRIRKTLLIPRYDLYYVGMFFDEMATPTERVYFQLDRVDGTHLAISSCSIPNSLSNVGIKIYYR